MSGVFVSHAHSDEPLVRALAAMLERLFGTKIGAVNYSSRKERGGIEKIEGSVVTVGPKFATLDPAEKASVLNLLSSRVFEVSAEGSMKPDQVLSVADASGKQVATFSADGFKEGN